MTYVPGFERFGRKRQFRMVWSLIRRKCKILVRIKTQVHLDERQWYLRCKVKAMVQHAIPAATIWAVWKAASIKVKLAFWATATPITSIYSVHHYAYHSRENVFHQKTIAVYNSRIEWAHPEQLYMSLRSQENPNLQPPFVLECRFHS